MNNVTQLYTWPVHICSPEDEWEALCGAEAPKMLAEGGQSLTSGLSWCSDCLKASRDSDGSTSTIE